MSTQWPLGAAVTWQPLSNSQRTAQAKHGRDNWVVAREGSYTIIAGEICVLVAPQDRAHESRWVRETQVRLVDQPVSQAEIDAQITTEIAAMNERREAAA